MANLSWPVGRRAALAWAFFDWANSAFPAVILTFVFGPYIVRGVAADPVSGAAAWSWAISLSALVVAVIAPGLGRLGDGRAWRVRALVLSSGLTVLACAGLWFVYPDPSSLVLGLVLVGLANIGFELGQVYYNALLPGLVSHDRLGRLSGWSWGLGYAGGLVCLVLALVLFVLPDTAFLGLSKQGAEQVRIVGPLAALWFLLFAWPTFCFVPEPPAAKAPDAGTLFQRIRALWAELRAVPGLLRFLLARMIYIDGLNTLFALGGIFAAAAIGLDEKEILVFGILMNVTAGLGAALFAVLDDSKGPERVILWSLIALMGLGAALLLVEGRIAFFILGGLLGLFFGPVQSASRSLMARLTPADRRATYFGLYALSGKATAFVGPALVGTLILALDSQRLGMSVILLFFLVGYLLLRPLAALRA